LIAVWSAKTRGAKRTRVRLLETIYIVFPEINRRSRCWEERLYKRGKKRILRQTRSSACKYESVAWKQRANCNKKLIKEVWSGVPVNIWPVFKPPTANLLRARLQPASPLRPLSSLLPLLRLFPFPKSLSLRCFFMSSHYASSRRSCILFPRRDLPWITSIAGGRPCESDYIVREKKFSSATTGVYTSNESDKSPCRWVCNLIITAARR